MTAEQEETTAMTKPGSRGIRRLVLATRYSMLGLGAAWRNEEAFRTEVLLCCVLAPAAFWLGETTVERLLLLLPLVLVLLMELANSAIESVVDRLGSEQHPLSGQAKDLGSAMVFVANLTVALVWGMIAWDRFMSQAG